MTQPPHFVDKQYPKKHLCLLKKALYGPKKAPKVWFDRFSLHLGLSVVRKIPHFSYFSVIER